MDTDITVSQTRELIRMVYDACGINLRKDKESLLKAKLAKRLRVTGIASARDYLGLIKRDPTEFAEFIDTVTTNHTFFFRENRCCEFLVPKLSSTKAGKGAPVKIWSAACSSGEEPYTIAIQLLESKLRFDIVASDISHTMLNFARQGVFPMNRVAQVPRPLLHRYFRKGHGSRDGYVKVKKEVRERVRFRKHNLLFDSLTTPFDVVFCRNVMIYFDTPTMQKVVDKLYSLVRPGGYFIIGQAEGLMNIEHRFTSVKNVPGTYVK